MTIRSTVKLADGTTSYERIQIYAGACMAGDPTAYFVRGNEVIWVVPTEDVPGCGFIQHETTAQRVRRERDALVCGQD